MMNASETLAQRSQGQDDYHVNPISNEGAMTATETKTNCSNVYLDEREARNVIERFIAACTAEP